MYCQVQHPKTAPSVNTMNEWMNEWMNKRMNEWMNKGMNEWIKEWMNEWMNKGMNEWMNEWMKGGWVGECVCVFYVCIMYLCMCMYVRTYACMYYVCMYCVYVCVLSCLRTPTTCIYPHSNNSLLSVTQICVYSARRTESWNISKPG
jgi:hypothetical protein